MIERPTERLHPATLAKRNLHRLQSQGPSTRFLDRKPNTGPRFRPCEVPFEGPTDPYIYMVKIWGDKRPDEYEQNLPRYVLADVHASAPVENPQPENEPRDGDHIIYTAAEDIHEWCVTNAIYYELAEEGRGPTLLLILSIPQYDAFEARFDAVSSKHVFGAYMKRIDGVFVTKRFTDYGEAQQEVANMIREHHPYLHTIRDDIDWANLSPKDLIKAAGEEFGICCGVDEN